MVFLIAHELCVYVLRYMYETISKVPQASRQAGPRSQPASASTSEGFWKGVVVAVVLGGTLRVVYTTLAASAPTSDGLHYSMAARQLAAGRGFINPVAVMANGSAIQDGVHPPGWTMLLGLVAATGHGSDGAFRLAAAAVGVGTIVMVGMAARAAFGPRVGVIAALITAVYPNIWLYEHELVSEPLAILGVATVLWLTYRFRSRPGPILAVALGLAVALAALTRSELILLSVLIVAPTIVLARVSWARRAGWAALAALGCLALIAPWTAYNRTRFEAVVPLSVGLGATMAAGNCDLTYDPSSRNFAYYEFACAIFSPVTSDDPSVSDGERRANVVRYIRDHPAGFVVTAAARSGRTFSFYAPTQQVDFEAERGTSAGVIRSGLFAYWLLVPLAIYGFVLARRRGVAVYPFVGLVLVVLAAVIPTIGAVRYRAPAEVAIVVLAAVGVDAVVRRLATRQPDRVADDDLASV